MSLTSSLSANLQDFLTNKQASSSQLCSCISFTHLYSCPSSFAHSSHVANNQPSESARLPASPHSSHTFADFSSISLKYFQVSSSPFSTYTLSWPNFSLICLNTTPVPFSFSQISRMSPSQPLSHCNPRSRITELVKRLGYSIIRSVSHSGVSSVNKSLND
ncbi:hypothetical protein ARMGADRAFT_562311 [Armillaria gallica]|uniref:Uncharacterized protein n=1 Tax=Armillaria gallica TaxID=47427 RepID=A0A2H3CQJ9_ARMGA|nr:hypothetical protein ARMGADRAFT_562311 [Armillaria gallica]